MAEIKQADRERINAVRMAHYAKADSASSADAVASRLRPVSDEHEHAPPAPKPAPKAKA